MSTYGSETINRAMAIPMIMPKSGYSDRFVEYVLDGQQRITAIYYAVKAPEKKLPKT